MGDSLNKGSLFPEALIPELFQKTKGYSVLTRLCNASPIPFNGMKEFTFTMDKEIDVVAESGAKTKGGVTVDPVTITPVKVEYGARVSDEFMYGADDYKINILKAFADGFARKLAKGFDMMAFHGINPRTATASTVIGDNNFDSKVTGNVTTITGAAVTDPDAKIEAAIAQVNADDYECNGLVLTPAYKAALAALTTGTGENANNVKVYPELAWGNNPGTINGLRTETTGTLATAASKDVALVGDFVNCFKWGIAKQIPLEVIQYGNPDNDSTLGDLKGHNQVYLRAEAFIGWGILDANAFARIVTSA